MQPSLFYQESAELCDSAISLVSQFIQATVRRPTKKEKQKDEQPPLGKEFLYITLLHHVANRISLKLRVLIFF